METACTRRTHKSKFIYSTERDRRSLVSATNANIKQQGVGLFAIASHFVSHRRRLADASESPRLYVRDIQHLCLSIGAFE